ncbi:DNA-binding protein [Ornithinibacillus halotolerans]|uniref:DNA-binding protein n=1 Tax=Ornithinibacillus halotolerans TaxID=1274357 RepID=A0A916W297_9BACI|nr:DNA-binding protein [Ornithinibacillus halotolerans]GGA60348.1 hypothetical protein GCM10008025_00450 [Ornithinibacillus halotolerans]
MFVLGLLFLAIGIAFLGYFIGYGLQNLGQPKLDRRAARFITADDLGIELNLSRKELEDLLRKYPNAPKIELDGKTYFQYNVFVEWLSTKEIYTE